MNYTKVYKFNKVFIIVGSIIVAIIASIIISTLIIVGLLFSSAPSAQEGLSGVLVNIDDNYFRYRGHSIFEEKNLIEFSFNVVDSRVMDRNKNITTNSADNSYAMMNVIIDYLKSNPDDPMNEYKIMLKFRRGSSDSSVNIRNYNHYTDEKYDNSYDFFNISVIEWGKPLSDFIIFKDVKILEYRGLKVDCLSGLSDFYNLEVLYRIHVPDFTEEEKSYIKSILPNIIIISAEENRDSSIILFPNIQ